MTNILDGKKFAENLRHEITQKVAVLKQKNIQPTLAVILVGEDPASSVYVRSKVKQTEQCGMRSLEFKMSVDASEKQLLDKIKELNDDDSVNGILVQLPLPKQINEDKVIQTIDARKDVDGFHLTNVGLLNIGSKQGLIPCTPHGCLMLLQDYFNNDLSGKNAVILGRSNIVGKPMAQLLLQANCTVTIVHSRTKNLEEHCKNADILVAAVGRPEMVKSSWVKDGAVVIDVGINRIERGGKNILVGDVDFNDVKEKCDAITPVPGGVGPMTIAVLLNNTYIAACQQNGIE